MTKKELAKEVARHLGIKPFKVDVDSLARNVITNMRDVNSVIITDILGFHHEIEFNYKAGIYDIGQTTVEDYLYE